ncbi:MAG: hypothetical protein E7557_08745 [Ruminococcaceae bacterium]|nr:hypothetical protein [Oscillospiraceae bacterium]
MKRKVLCSILAILIVLASVPMTAFAADEVTITKVDLTATKNLIEGYNCHIEYDGEKDETFNYYYLDDTLPNMTLTFSDGSTKDITFDEYWDYFTDSIWCEQGAGDKELKPGTHTKTVCLTYGYNEETQQSEGVMAEYTFTIEPNPIESISAVATKPLVENVDGRWEDKIETDENGNEVVVGKTFFYYVAETAPIVTVNYKNGDTKTIPYDVWGEFDYSVQLYDSNTLGIYKLGEDNIAEVEVLGVKAEFTFAIIPDPIESITVTPTTELREFVDGVHIWADDEDPFKGIGYFDYDLSATYPVVTVTFNDGRDPVTCGWDECYGLFEDEPSFDSENARFNVGENTVKVDFLDREIDYTFTIEESPVENVSVKILNNLTVDVSGYMDYESRYDEETDEYYDVPYFKYDIDGDIEVTIEYKDESKEADTFTLNNIHDYFDESSHETYLGKQDSETKLTVGEHKGILAIFGKAVEFDYEIIANPVESITVTPTTELREFVDGVHIWADDEDPFKGIGYFDYDLSATYPVVTVTFNDGRDPVTCGWDECYDLFEDEPSFDSENARFNVGENTVKVDFLGRETDYTFTIEESPVKNVSVKILNNLTVDVSGYMDYESLYDEETDEYYEVPYFKYDINTGDIEVTIEYKDESKEADTFTLNNIHDYFDETSFVTYLGKQDSETKLTVGEHKGILAIFGKAVEFDYEIATNPVKKVEVIVNNELIENRYGYWTETEDGEEYYYYFLDDLDIDLKVTFTDGTVKEYKTDKDLNECSYPWEIEIDQEYNPFKKGENSAKIIFNGVEAEFTIKVVEDPVESVTLTPTKAITQYVDGWLEFDNEGETFYHDVYLTYPDITFNYKDGTKKTYSYAEYGRFFNGGIDFDTEETRQNPMKLGENTVKAYVHGYPTEYTFVLKKADKEVTKFEIAPEKPLVENTSGTFLLSPDDKHYPIYFPNQITYTVKLTYSDGTTKTYKNVKANDKIEGSCVGVDFHCYDFSQRYVIGAENTAVAWYRNHSCEFKVPVAENTYTAAALSGDTDLKLTLTKKDGTKEVYTAKYFEPGEGGDGFVAGTLYTDKGELSIGIEFDFDEKTATFKNFELLYGKAGGSDSFIRSNKLESNKWLNNLQMHDILSTVGSTAAMFADGYAKYYFGTEFTGFGGTFKGIAVDEALAMSAMMVYIEDFEYVEEDEKGAFTILTLDEAKDLAGQIFDVSKIDFASSPSYDAKTNTIKVRLQVYPEGYLNDQSFKYQNGKYILTMNWEAEFTETVMPVRIVVSEAGIIESVSFTEASCGDIKTITAVNAKGGVKVTYSAADNATEYEIYRSTNGSAAVKIATTSSLEYLDTTAKSNTTYTYKVRGINSSVQGNFSGVKTVKYLAMPKTTATISKTGFTVKWNKIDGASTYRIYRAEYVNGKWSGWTKLSDQKASVTSFADKNVKAGGIYKYTVRALASGGVASAYEGTPTLVYLLTPTVKIANAKGGVKATWNAVSGAKSYAIYRSEYNATTKKWSNWTNLGTTNSTTKSFTDKTAVSGKTYRYTVRAVNGNNMSLYTASNTLLYLAEPTVTIANAKAGITVKWTKSGGATGYTIYRSQYNSSTKKWSGWSTMGTAKGTATSWTDKSAKAGVTYKYTVRAVNDKVKSTYTASASLVRLTEPTVAIANAKTGITVKWSKVAGATGYTVYRQEFVNGKWSSWVNRGTAKANKTSWTDTKAESGKTYRYTVRAVNGKHLSSYTPTGNLIFLGEPTVKIANAANGVKVSWSAVAGAKGYTVYRSEYNAKTKKWSGWSNRGTAAATKTSWTDKKVTSGVYYKYTVRAVSGSYRSTYTSSAKLLYLATPTVTVAKVAAGVSVKWNKTAGAANYIVYRQEKIDGAWSNWTVLGTVKTTSYSDKTAQSGKEYRYTVRAVNGNYKSVYTASSTVNR